MIPSSAFTFFALVLIVLPGFAFTLSRARYKPDRKESALQEMSRVLTVSLIANLAVGIPFYGWWAPPVRRLVNNSSSDLFQGYFDALIPLVGVTLASSGLTFAVGEILYRRKYGHQRQAADSTLDIAFTLGKGKSSISFITLSDDTEIAGRVARYDNSAEAPHHFMEILSPYWIGSREKRKGLVFEDANLFIPISIVKFIQLQTLDAEDLSADELRRAFPTSKEGKSFLKKLIRRRR